MGSLFGVPLRGRCRGHVDLLEAKIDLNGGPESLELGELSDGRQVPALGVIEPFRGAGRGCGV